MTSRRLVVVVPAWMGDPAKWTPLVERLRAEHELEGSDWLIWDYSYGPVSRASAKRIAHSLGASIHQKWVESGGYDEILVLAHSFGGLLARQAYLLACKQEPGFTEEWPWQRSVTRIVLFAAINRGVDPRNKWRLRIINWMTSHIPWFTGLLVREMMRGSDFVTNLRIQWIRYFHELGERAPIVVQLLGDHDGLVTREDSIDVEQFPTTYHATIPDADHCDLHRVDIAPDPDGRYALIRDAILTHGAALSKDSRYMQRTKTRGPDRIVFVVHGIRAYNFGWPEQLAELIESRAPDVRAVRPTYGYLSALRFAIPTIRKLKLQWFKDQYTYWLARNPAAEFHFIGHSNGTYLLGESLRRLSAMRFHNVVLVGSVLPDDYPWDACIGNRQVENLRNDRSRKDFPVAVLCSGMRGLGMRDIGTGGFVGFRNALPQITEVFWYDGGHSKPLEYRNLENLADFVLTKPPIISKSRSLRSRPSSSYLRLSRWAPVLFPLIGAGILALLFYWLFFAPVWARSCRALLALAVFLFVAILLDRL